jgi:hypothetical protein
LHFSLSTGDLAFLAPAATETIKLALMPSAFAGGKQPMAGGQQPMAVLGELVTRIQPAFHESPALSLYAINEFSDVEPYFAC